MHPIVIMAYDKSPAITKAVAALEEAGLEVRVLNTNSAKLADFLGALAGEDEPVMSVMSVVADAADDAEEEEEEEDVKPATEAIVNGEKVIVEIIDGADMILHSSKIATGAKTFYSLGESDFSFWPTTIKESQAGVDTSIKGGVELSIGGSEVTQLTVVSFSEVVMDPPVLKIGREWFKEARQEPRGWAVLPAASAIFDKAKVTPDDIERECCAHGKIMIIRRSSNSYPSKESILMMPGGGDKVGTESEAYHDQNFGKLGTFTVIGHLEKDGDEWKLSADSKKIPGLETPEQIKKFKAALYVFK